MFDNIGGKIKLLAKILCWIGIVASIVCGLNLILGTWDITTSIFLGFVVMVLGSFGSWVGAFALYGFGQLVEDNENRTALTEEILQEQEKIVALLSGQTLGEGKALLLKEETESLLLQEQLGVPCPRCNQRVRISRVDGKGRCKACNTIFDVEN